MSLTRRRGFDARRIVGVVARGGPEIRSWCEPVDERRRPRNPASAANSVIYSISKALANGTVGLEDFTQGGMAQAEALRIAELVICELDDAHAGAGTVEATLGGGPTFTEKVSNSLGGAGRPLDRVQLAEKFFDCAAHAPSPLPGSWLDELIHEIWSLDAVDDVARIAELARGPRL